MTWQYNMSQRIYTGSKLYALHPGRLYNQTLISGWWHKIWIQFPPSAVQADKKIMIFDLLKLTKLRKYGPFKLITAKAVFAELSGEPAGGPLGLPVQRPCNTTPQWQCLQQGRGQPQEDARVHCPASIYYNTQRWSALLQCIVRQAQHPLPQSQQIQFSTGEEYENLYCSRVSEKCLLNIARI